MVDINCCSPRHDHHRHECGDKDPISYDIQILRMKEEMEDLKHDMKMMNRRVEQMYEMIMTLTEAMFKEDNDGR